MTKSKIAKWLDSSAGQSESFKSWNRRSKTPSLLELEQAGILRHCHKKMRMHCWELKKGDVVCLYRAKPKKRRKYQDDLWYVKYVDCNGYCELVNASEYDEEGSKENREIFDKSQFPETEIWDLDATLIRFLLPRLKAFIESERHGYPINLLNPESNNDTDDFRETSPFKPMAMTKRFDDAEDFDEEAEKKAVAAWESILWNMYEGLSLHVDGEDAKSIRARIKKEHPGYSDERLWDIEYALEAEAMKLFQKHIFDLWD